MNDLLVQQWIYDGPAPYEPLASTKWTTCWCSNGSMLSQHCMNDSPALYERLAGAAVALYWTSSIWTTRQYYMNDSLVQHWFYAGPALYERLASTIGTTRWSSNGSMLDQHYMNDSPALYERLAGAATFLSNKKVLCWSVANIYLIYMAQWAAREGNHANRYTTEAGNIMTLQWKQSTALWSVKLV